MVDGAKTYPFNLPIVQGFTSITFDPKVTFIVGKNGSGKSTLLEAIAIGMGFNPEGGSKNFRFSTQDSHSELEQAMHFVKSPRKARDGYFLRAETFYNVASEIDRLDQGAGGPQIKDGYGGRSLHEQSHGESFMSLIEHRFGPKGLYILDEPEAALSPARQYRLLARLKHLTEAGSQFIVATYSPIVMGFPEATIFVVKNSVMSPARYEDTEHYR